MQRRQGADQSAVGLLGKRVVEIARSQACLDVGDRNLAVKGRLCPCESRGGVALHQYDGRCSLRERFVEPLQKAGEELTERLVGPHGAKVQIGAQIVLPQNLVE